MWWITHDSGTTPCKHSAEHKVPYLSRHSQLYELRSRRRSCDLSSEVRFSCTNRNRVIVVGWEQSMLLWWGNAREKYQRNKSSFPVWCCRFFITSKPCCICVNRHGFIICPIIGSIWAVIVSQNDVATDYLSMVSMTCCCKICSNWFITRHFNECCMMQLNKNLDKLDPFLFTEMLHLLDTVEIIKCER